MLELICLLVGLFVGAFIGWNASQPEWAVSLQATVTKVVTNVIRKFK